MRLINKNERNALIWLDFHLFFEQHFSYWDKKGKSSKRKEILRGWNDVNFILITVYAAIKTRKVSFSHLDRSERKKLPARKKISFANIFKNKISWTNNKFFKRRMWVSVGEKSINSSARLDIDLLAFLIRRDTNWPFSKFYFLCL